MNAGNAYGGWGTLVNAVKTLVENEGRLWKPEGALGSWKCLWRLEYDPGGWRECF